MAIEENFRMGWRVLAKFRLTMAEQGVDVAVVQIRDWVEHGQGSRPKPVMDAVATLTEDSAEAWLSKTSAALFTRERGSTVAGDHFQGLRELYRLVVDSGPDGVQSQALALWRQEQYGNLEVTRMTEAIVALVGKVDTDAPRMVPFEEIFRLATDLAPYLAVWAHSSELRSKESEVPVGTAP